MTYRFTKGTHTNGMNWTASLNVGGSTTGITYTTQTSMYYVTEQMVYLQFMLLLSSLGSGSGNLTITGLPYTSRNTANLDMYSYLYLVNSGVTLGAGYSFTNIQLLHNSSTLNLLKGGSGKAAVSLQNTDIGNTTALHGTIIYFI